MRPSATCAKSVGALTRRRPRGIEAPQGDRLCSFRYLAEQSLCAFVKSAPLIRQPQRVTTPLDQPRTQVLFKFGHAARQRSLSSPRTATRSAEATVHGHQVEIGQCLQVHELFHY